MAYLLHDNVYDCFARTIQKTVTKGLVEQIQDCIGFYFNDCTYSASTSKDVTFVYKAKQARVGKKSATGEDINPGEKVYADPSDLYNVSATKSTGFLFVGWAKEYASGIDTDVLIEFDGTLFSVL